MQSRTAALFVFMNEATTATNPYWAQAFIAEALMLPDIIDRALWTFSCTQTGFGLLIDMPHCVAGIMA